MMRDTSYKVVKTKKTVFKLKPITEIFPTLDIRGFEAEQLLCGNEYSLSVTVNGFTYPLSLRDVELELVSEKDDTVVCEVYTQNPVDQKYLIHKDWIGDRRVIEKEEKIPLDFNDYEKEIYVEDKIYETKNIDKWRVAAAKKKYNEYNHDYYNIAKK